MNKKRFSINGLSAAAAMTAVLFTTGCGTPGPETGSRPNILYIMIDDLGWMDLRCQGNPAYRTPNIDRLAGDGMRFTDAYAAAPVCSPTRAAAMTGLAPARLRITNHIPDRWQFYKGRERGPGRSVNYLDPQYVTIAERLKAAGYATAFMGKWHLSGTSWSDENRRYLPENQGFDINVGGCHQGGPGGKGSFFDPFQVPNIPSRNEGQYLPDRLADEAVSFMKKQSDANKPFFLCLWNYTVHWPVEAPDALYKKYAAGPPDLHQKYQAMVEGMDRAVGTVLAALDRLHLADDTLVVFTSDNGPFCGDNNEMTSAAPLKDSKGYLGDGGIRVPLIIRWPGTIQKNTVCSDPVITMDFVPTFLDAAGVEYGENDFDGESLLPVLTGTGTLRRDAIYVHFPHYAFHRDNRMGGIIRAGDYKLVRYYDNNRVALYNMREDIGETNDLAKRLPEMTARLSGKLDAWLKETKAAMPRPTGDIPEDELYGKK